MEACTWKLVVITYKAYICIIFMNNYVQAAINGVASRNDQVTGHPEPKSLRLSWIESHDLGGRHHHTSWGWPFLWGDGPSFLIAFFRSLDLGFIAFGCLGAQTLCKSGTQFVKDAISEPFLSSNEFQSTCGHAPLPYIYRAAIFCRDVFISSFTVIHLISIWSLSRIGCCPHCWVGDWGIHPHHQTATSPFEYRFYGLYLQECENTWHFSNSNIN